MCQIILRRFVLIERNLSLVIMYQRKYRQYNNDFFCQSKEKKKTYNSFAYQVARKLQIKFLYKCIFICKPHFRILGKAAPQVCLAPMNYFDLRFKLNLQVVSGLPILFTTNQL